MSWTFDQIHFYKKVERAARKIAAAGDRAPKQEFAPADSTVDAFWHLVRNDPGKLRAWMAPRSPEEVAFFRMLWKQSNKKSPAEWTGEREDDSGRRIIATELRRQLI